MIIRVLRALALLALVAPLAAIAVTAALWLPRLPTSIAVQWSANGVSATAPALVLAAGSGIVAAVAAIIGVATVLGARSAPELGNARGPVAGYAAVAGAASALWIACAALSLGDAPMRAADIGGWPLLALALGLVWAAAPALLLTAAGALVRRTAPA